MKKAPLTAPLSPTILIWKCSFRCWSAEASDSAGEAWDLSAGAEVERGRVVMQEEGDASAEALADVHRVVHLVLVDLDLIANAHDDGLASPALPRRVDGQDEAERVVARGQQGAERIGPRGPRSCRAGYGA